MTKPDRPSTSRMRGRRLTAVAFGAWTLLLASALFWSGAAADQVKGLLNEPEEQASVAGRQPQEERAGGTGETGELEPRRRVRGPRWAVGDTIVVPADTIHDGEIGCIFGEVVIEGIVTKPVIVIGGSVRVSGAIRKDLIAVLSEIVLEPGARIGGDLINAAGSLEDMGAEVRKGYIDIPLGLRLPGLGGPFSVIGSVMLWFRSLSMVLFFIVILILAALVPERIRNIGEEASVRYFVALFVGLAGYLGFPILLLLLITLVLGIPFVPFAILAFIVLTWLGRAGILYMVGARIGRMLGGEMTLLGAVVLGLVPYALLLMVPLLIGGIAGILAHCVISSILWLVIDVPAIGLILLTRAGAPRRRAPAPPPAAEPAPAFPGTSAPPPASAGPPPAHPAEPPAGPPGVEAGPPPPEPPLEPPEPTEPGNESDRRD